MNNLKELIKYLKNQENGSSMSELKEVCPEDALKQFLKTGLESGEIFTEGKKRGTRYYAKGATPVVKATKEKPSEVEEYANSLEHEDLDFYLKSDKPIPGQGVFTKVINFGKDDDNITSFLKAGVVIEQYYIQYDKIQKKNIIAQKTTHTIYNRIGIRQQGRNFILQKFYSHGNTIKVESFKNYEDLREQIRALFYS